MTDAITRRTVITGALASLTVGGASRAQSSHLTFAQWVATFQSRARARGVSDATYDRVMTGLKPDTSVYVLDRAQPEFHEELWQYLNRRVSEWRIQTGKERARAYGSPFGRVGGEDGV